MNDIEKKNRNTQRTLGFPRWFSGMPANAGDGESIPGSGRSPGEGNGNPL